MHSRECSILANRPEIADVSEGLEQVPPASMERRERSDPVTRVRKRALLGAGFRVTSGPFLSFFAIAIRHTLGPQFCSDAVSDANAFLLF